MTRRAYLRRRARRLRHGVTRNAHGSRRRRRAADTVRLLTPRERLFVGIDVGRGASSAVVVKAMGNFVEVVEGAASALQSLTAAVASAMLAIRNSSSGGDEYERLEQAGAPPEVLEALRAAEAVWRLSPDEDPIATFTAIPGGIYEQIMIINERRRAIGLAPLLGGDRLP